MMDPLPTAYTEFGQTLAFTERAMTAALILESTLTCPICGHPEREIMATDSCQYLYECSACHALHEYGEIDWTDVPPQAAYETAFLDD